MECRFCPRSQPKSDLNGSQEFSDEIEELFSVFKGTTSGNDQENLGVKKYPEETKEPLEVCEGTKNERRGIQDMSNWRNVLKFRRRMSTHVSQGCQPRPPRRRRVKLDHSYSIFYFVGYVESCTGTLCLLLRYHM